MLCVRVLDVTINQQHIKLHYTFSNVNSLKFILLAIFEGDSSMRNTSKKICKQINFKTSSINKPLID